MTNHPTVSVAEQDPRGDEDDLVERVLTEDHQRINVDFDNTLTRSNVRYWAGERPEPDEDVCAWVRQRYRGGDTVVVWTARPWREAGAIAAHLTEWSVPYHGIRCNKGSADVYVDDKALHPEDL